MKKKTVDYEDKFFRTSKKLREAKKHISGLEVTIKELKADYEYLWKMRIMDEQERKDIRDQNWRNKK